MSVYYIEDKNGDYFSTDRKKRFIKLSGKKAYEYLSTHRGKRFYKLTSEEDNEDNIFIEVPASKVGKVRKDKRRVQYVANCKKKAGLSRFPYMTFKRIKTAKGAKVKN